MFCRLRTEFGRARIPSLTGLAGSLLVGGALAAHAEPATPLSEADTYSLFNAAPTSALRNFSPDRPAKATGPYTVDAGHFQYEMEVLNFARQKTEGMTTTTWIGPSTTLKLGLTSWMDVQLAFAPFEQVRSKEAELGDEERWSGNSDLLLRSKINVWGNDGGKTALALVPFLKVPTARTGIGNGATEGGLVVPLAVSLPSDMSLTFNSEFDVLKDSEAGGYHTGYVNSVGITAPVMKDVSLTVELWSFVNPDSSGTVRQYSFDTALAWTVRSDLQIDVGANIGLNTDTPALQVYTGIAQRF